MSYPPFGVQLIMFQQHPDYSNDLERILDAIQRAGFRAIECGVDTSADYPRFFKGMLNRRNLRIAGLHGTPNLDIDATLRLMEIYETKDLCISGLGGWGNTIAENYLRDIDKLARLGRLCKRHGVSIHYHNHAYEFLPTDEGPTGMELILGNLDPELVDLCVDVAWVRIGGQDPLAFLQRYANRIGYIHLKDYTGDRHWVPLGQGEMPMERILSILPQLLRVRWAIYEQDSSEDDPLEDCQASFRYLRRIVLGKEE